jgi:hypothetical protein
MYARVTMFQTQLGKCDEATQIIREPVISA